MICQAKKKKSLDQLVKCRHKKSLDKYYSLKLLDNFSFTKHH